MTDRHKNRHKVPAVDIRKKDSNLSPPKRPKLASETLNNDDSPSSPSQLNPEPGKGDEYYYLRSRGVVKSPSSHLTYSRSPSPTSNCWSPVTKRKRSGSVIISPPKKRRHSGTVSAWSDLEDTVEDELMELVSSSGEEESEGSPLLLLETHSEDEQDPRLEETRPDDEPGPAFKRPCSRSEFKLTETLRSPADPSRPTIITSTSTFSRKSAVAPPQVVLSRHLPVHDMTDIPTETAVRGYNFVSNII